MYYHSLNRFRRGKKIRFILSVQIIDAWVHVCMCIHFDFGVLLFSLRLMFFHLPSTTTMIYFCCAISLCTLFQLFIFLISFIASSFRFHNTEIVLFVWATPFNYKYCLKIYLLMLFQFFYVRTHTHPLLIHPLRKIIVSFFPTSFNSIIPKKIFERHLYN